MELEIYWTEFSENELLKIFEYHAKKASSKIAEKLTTGIYDETLKLIKQPEIGQVEELLEEYKNQFRYLVYKNYKIIYWINKDQNRIEINDVFDTRQNPPKIKRIK